MYAPRHVGLSAGPAYVPGAEMECRVHWGALVRFLRKSLDLSTMIKCLCPRAFASSPAEALITMGSQFLKSFSLKAGKKIFTQAHSHLHPSRFLLEFMARHL